VSVVCTLADSYVDASARDAGSAAELAAFRKIDKYSALEKTHFFQPVAVESLGPMNIAAYSFWPNLDERFQTFLATIVRAAICSSGYLF